MKRIRTKILVIFLSLLLAPISIVAFFSTTLNLNGTLKTLENTMSKTAIVAANGVAEKLEGYKMLAIEIARNYILTGDNFSKEEKIAELHRLRDTHGVQSVSLTGPEGSSLETGSDINDREYYQFAKTNKKPFVSTPLIRKNDNSLAIMVSAPVLKDGNFNGIIYIALDGAFLTELAKGVKIGETGSALMLDKRGITIANPDIEKVKTQSNIIERAKKETDYAQIASYAEKMMAGENGFGEYALNGEVKLIAYAPIPHTDGWSIAVDATKSEFMRDTMASIYIILIVSASMLLVSVWVTVKVANSIAVPIKRCAERLSLLAKGDLTTAVPKVKSKDEINLLAESMRISIGTLSSYISDIDEKMESMAVGNFDIQFSLSYVGDFKSIEMSMHKIANSLNETLMKINSASEEVSNGANQLSNAAQSLSQGTTEQASSIQQLSASIEDISKQVQENAKNAKSSESITNDAGMKMLLADNQMSDMLFAMDGINETSQKISKIIKTIDDIAFQTNILALNAAVEAARAGEKGKGFAVVADEVRNLASKSAEAAKETAKLIEDSISAVDKGGKIAAGAAQSLKAIVVDAKQSAELAGKISSASEAQAQALSQITQGISQISSVVQTNSATAQESAATSEQLNGQAQLLTKMVSKFELRKEERQY